MKQQFSDPTGLGDLKWRAEVGQQECHPANRGLVK